MHTWSKWFHLTTIPPTCTAARIFSCLAILSETLSFTESKPALRLELMIASTSGIVPSAARALRNFTAWKKNRGKRKCSRAFQSTTDKQYMPSFFSSQRRVLALLFFVFSHLSEKEMIWFARCATRCSSPLHSATLLDFIQLILRLINVRGHRFSFEFCKLFT